MFRSRVLLLQFLKEYGYFLNKWQSLKVYLVDFLKKKKKSIFSGETPVLFEILIFLCWVIIMGGDHWTIDVFYRVIVHYDLMNYVWINGSIRDYELCKDVSFNLVTLKQLFRSCSLFDLSITTSFIVCPHLTYESLLHVNNTRKYIRLITINERITTITKLRLITNFYFIFIYYF